MEIAKGLPLSEIPKWAYQNLYSQLEKTFTIEVKSNGIYEITNGGRVESSLVICSNVSIGFKTASKQEPQDELRERWLYIAANYELCQSDVALKEHVSYNVNAFKKFIQKDESINQKIKQAVLSSLKIVKELLRQNPNKERILHLIQTSKGLHYKNWLQQKAEAL